MHDHPRGLIDDNHIGILIDDWESQRLRLRCSGDRLGNIDADGLTPSNRLVWLRSATVDQDVPVLDQPLDLRSRVVPENRGEKDVKPRAASVVGDRDDDVTPPSFERSWVPATVRAPDRRA